MSSLSGALAGLTAVLVTYPLELVRTRMAFRICTDETVLAYRTLTSSLRQVLSQEGALGLTLTLTPTPTLTLTLTLSLTLTLTLTLTLGDEQEHGDSNPDTHGSEHGLPRVGGDARDSGHVT